LLVTDWSNIVVPALPELEPFDTGAVVSEVRALDGLEETVKLNWNENLFGPLPGVLEAVRQELESLSLYPVEAYGDFREEVARFVGTTPGRIVPGHGTQGLIVTVASAFLRPGDHVVVPVLTFGLYAQVSTARGATVHRVPMHELRLDLDPLAETARQTGARLVWICDPNNPTGDVVGREEWAAFLEALPERCVVVADEAYIDYLPVERRVGRERDVEDGRPVIVLRSFSKFFGLAGLRLGYAIVDEALASYLDLVEEPFNMNCAGLAAGRACLRAAEAADERRGEVADGREALTQGLREAGAEPLPSEANFVLARVDVDDSMLAERLAARSILIRAGSELGLPGYVRITVGPSPLMRRVTGEFDEVCAELRS
jgi:histidinol-phosphate aminotransferase